MEQVRQILRKAVRPKTVFVVLLAILSGAALAFVFVKGYEHSLFAYTVYPVSAYSLVVVVVRLAGISKAGRDKLHSNALYHKYSTDLNFKAVVSIHLSLAVTLFYCVTKTAAGIYYRSAWFGSMAFYYILLALARYLLFRHVRRDDAGKLQAHKKYCFCGYLLFVLTAALAAMSFYAIYDDKAITYPGFMIYAAAAYTFYNFTIAIFNLVRYRKLNNPIYSASKMLALAAALVSLFFLQTSMFAVFGDGSEWQRYMNISTGFFVFLLIAGIAIFMIVTGRRAISKLA